MANERLIDANAFMAYIEKQYCKPCKEHGQDYNEIRCRACWVDDMSIELDAQPTVDAVEVVRCKDCVHYCHDRRYGTICRHPEMDFDIECYDQWLNTEPDDFCSYGERRDDV